MLVEVWMSAFRASGGMPSGPAALLDFSDFMALMISYLVGGWGWGGGGSVNSKEFSRWWDI